METINGWVIPGAIVLLIFFTEGIWEFFSGFVPQSWKTKAQEKNFPLDRFGALAVSLILCFGAVDVDILADMGLPFKWGVGAIVVTAVFVARLSNPAHDFIKLIEDRKKAQRISNDYLNNDINAGM